MPAEVYGADDAPDIVRREPSDDHRADAVAEGRRPHDSVAVPRRHRRFVAPEPSASTYPAVADTV